MAPAKAEEVDEMIDRADLAALLTSREIIAIALMVALWALIVWALGP